MLVDVLRGLETRPALLRKVQMMRVTGAYCSPDLQKVALERLTDEIIMTYGANETGPLAWGRSRDLLKLEQLVGQLFDDVEVAAFDANGEQLAQGSDGEIRARVSNEGVGMYLGSAPVAGQESE
jgi:acyl-coenzyme A synthetase/AMP-(fatty) acid ligase